MFSFSHFQNKGKDTNSRNLAQKTLYIDPRGHTNLPKSTHGQKDVPRMQPGKHCPISILKTSLQPCLPARRYAMTPGESIGKYLRALLPASSHHYPKNGFWENEDTFILLNASHLPPCSGQKSIPTALVPLYLKVFPVPHC